jgi:hypothetical protein
MKPSILLSLLLPLSILLSSDRAAAQDPPETPPATAPTAPPRHEAKLPPGFQRIDLEGREFMVDPADQPWITSAVQNLTPATMPTTMPSDLIERLQAKRPLLHRRIVADLGLTVAEVDEYLDQRLKPFLQSMDELHPPIVYLVVTPQRLKEIMRAGWTDPRYYYNRAADDVSFSTVVNLSLDGPGDDMVVPLFYDDRKPPEERQQMLTREMHKTEVGILNAFSQRSQTMVMVGLVELVSSKGLNEMNFTDDQEWFGVGAAGVLAGRYASELIGLDEQRLLDDMSRPDPRNPMRPGTIDLLRPTPLSEVRPQWLEAYTDAFRRRSMQAVRTLTDRAGEDAIGKVIAAMKQSRPADGPALVQLIQQTTGVDMTAELRPG